MNELNTLTIPLSTIFTMTVGISLTTRLQHQTFKKIYQNLGYWKKWKEYTRSGKFKSYSNQIFVL